MKTRMLSLLIVLTMSVQFMYGQCLPNPNHTTPFFYPDNDQIPCIEQGIPYSFDLQVRCYDSIIAGGLEVEWLRIDSITNLPSGINWSMNVPAGNPANTLNANQNGCINFSGITNDFATIYEPQIWACLKVSLSPSPICDNLKGLEETLLSFITTLEPSYLGREIKFTVTGQSGICQAGTGSSAQINGKVFFDENGNGIYDGNDVPITNSAISISPVPFTVYTNSNGDYSLYTTAQNVSLSLNPPPYFSLSSSAAPHFNNIQAGQIITGADFGLTADTIIHDVGVNITQSAARPGFTTTIWIDLQNNGTQPESGKLHLTYDNVLTYQSSNIPFSDHTGNELVFDYTNLAPGAQTQISVVFQIPADVNLLGNTLVSTAFADNNNAERNLENNYATAEQTVTGSYDPNDKHYSPYEDILKNGVALGEHITYTIRFQNTGTDTAFTVVIRDTLNPDVFDLTTFKPIGSSHTYKLQMSGNGELVWIFNNILLPDSGVNEAGSNGYVKFSVAVKNNLEDRTPVENIAAIYFDFNPPIITNTAATKVNIYLSVEDAVYKKDGLKIYPHPVAQQSVIAFDKQYQNISLQVFDLAGKLIIAETFAQTDKIMLNRQGMSSGIFFYSIRADKELFKGKVAVE